VSLVFILGSVSFAETVVIEDILKGDQTISVDTQLLSIIQGNATVASGITFQVDGIITGNLTLQEGSILVLNGIVEGNIYNYSGNSIDENINGIIKGEIIENWTILPSKFLHWEGVALLIFLKKIINTTLKSVSGGFSMIEVIVVIVIAGFALLALSSLFLGTNLTKTTNENLLSASNLAVDVVEHLKKTSINNYNYFQDLLEIENSKTIYFEDIFNEVIPITDLYSDYPPASLNTLAESKNFSYVYFEVLERNSFDNKVNKLLAKVVIKWKEITREQSNEREYSVATYIFKNGLGYFLK